MCFSTPETEIIARQQFAVGVVATVWCQEAALPCGMAFSELQIREALRALDLDPATVLDQLPDRETPEEEAAGIRHAALVGLLYRALATELREAVSGAEQLEQFMDRYLAVSPQNITVDGEDHTAQALFDAGWLDDRVAALAAAEHHPGGPWTVSTLHSAISHAAEATKVLLEINHGRRSRDDENGELEQIQLETVDDRLDRCAADIEQVRQGVTTRPRFEPDQ